MHHPSTDKDDEYYLVMCMYCFARTVGETVGEANEAWNRRAPEIPIVRPRNREGKEADARRKIIAEPKEIAVEEGRTND